ncbi:GalNAc(5)-diNAcBac-PP-undecaprenol beta-1,3-glucosyltransferase [compost metagenome]
MIKCSVVIPAKSREELLQRAIDSVINSTHSEIAEIIIIDDHSSPPLSPSNLREQDRLIRLNRPSGAAIARNRGIAAARGDVIYLLDSDDYFIEKNFLIEHKQATETNCIYYSEITSQGYTSCFPYEVSIEKFFELIFFKTPHICQTSSLYFSKSVEVRFDESLPKHQDWDFVYSALIKNIKVIKGLGTVYFDRSDQSSISRKQISSRSTPWFNKLRSAPETISEAKLLEIRYHIFSQHPDSYSWKSFITHTAQLLYSQKTNLKCTLRKLLRRIINVAQ